MHGQAGMSPEVKLIIIAGLVGLAAWIITEL